MRSGARTGDEIRQAIDKKREFSGVTGRIIFNEKGDVTDKPVAIKMVKNGKFEPFKKEG
jgi:ABC-type branched-subunit amino acid transport system substrate-binding protein